MTYQADDSSTEGWIIAYNELRHRDMRALNKYREEVDNLLVFVRDLLPILYVC
jgi:hypothetical protein